VAKDHVVDRPPVNNMLDLQRMSAVKAMGERIRELQAEGCYAEADELLDEMSERIKAWRQSEASGEARSS
jgi:hypothetical protein